jgi:hypothetical protein
MFSSFPSLISQMEVHCQTSFCQNEDGFPKLLRACTVRLGIRSQPEYDGREFVEHGTEKCVVTVYIGSSPHHMEWSVTTAGHRFKDTCQVVARKALRTLCQLYEEEVADTPLRLFPPFQRDRPVWMARMRALEGKQILEDDPTVTYLTAYLLTLDAQYDFLARHHRQMIAQAEDAEKRNRQLHVDLTSAQARVAALESREAIVVEALKQAKDEHVQKLMEAYLVTHNQRRALRIQEPAPSNPVQPICKENGPRAIWLIEFWCLMNNTIRELISFLVVVFVVHRMRRELDQGNEDATPQRRHYKTHRRHYKVILKTLYIC